MNLALPKNIQVWGLTGGIGSGKSLAAHLFEDMGIPVINLDLLGKELLDNDIDVWTEIRKIFGDKVFLKTGIDRSAIRKIVFQDQTKRESLEKLLHPKIWELFKKRVEIKANKGATLIFCEAALLIEHHHENLFPRLIVVMAQESLRRRRVIERDNISPELFDEILKTQTDDETRRKLATYILENDGSPGELQAAIHSLVTNWKKEGSF